MKVAVKNKNNNMSVYLKIKVAQAKLLLDKAKREMYKLAVAVVIAEFILVTGYAIGESRGLFDRFKSSNPLVIENVHAQIGLPKEANNPLGDRNDTFQDCYGAIDSFAGEYGAYTELGRRIVEKESGGKERAENQGSTATGCFQFVIGTWRTYGKQLWGDDFYSKNVYNAKDNVELGLWAISQFGTKDWRASGF